MNVDIAWCEEVDVENFNHPKDTKQTTEACWHLELEIHISENEMSYRQEETMRSPKT